MCTDANMDATEKMCNVLTFLTNVCRSMSHHLIPCSKLYVRQKCIFSVNNVKVDKSRARFQNLLPPEIKNIDGQSDFT